MKHWKHTVAILLALCLIGVGTALAQDEWQLCRPEEVDVSGVQEINGRLVGEIALPESAGHIRLMVDCPVPEPFTAQQQAVLTVRYQEVTKGDISAAIEAAGQSVKGGKLEQYYNDDPLNRHVSFSRDGEDCNFSVYERFARDLAGHPNQREMEASVALAPGADGTAGRRNQRGLPLRKAKYRPGEAGRHFQPDQQQLCAGALQPD